MAQQLGRLGGKRDGKLLGVRENKTEDELEQLAPAKNDKRKKPITHSRGNRGKTGGKRTRKASLPVAQERKEVSTVVSRTKGGKITAECGLKQS